MKDLDTLFTEFARSSFRRRFALRGAELAYARARHRDAMVRHASELLRTRLFSALPAKDGRQTPYRGHPVFVAQHATATCCRGCLLKWHGIPKGRELTEHEKEHVLRVIQRWLTEQGV